jgi:hypothetical protein
MQDDGVCGVRGRRVVLAAKAGVKSMEVSFGSTGLSKALNPKATVAIELISPGRAR